MKKFISSLIAGMLIVGTLSGCATKPAADSKPVESGKPAAGVEATTDATTPKDPAAVKDPKDMKIFFVTKLVGTQYWSVVEQGIKDACEDLGIPSSNLTINGPAADSEVEKQIQILQDAVAAKPDVIILAPTDSTAMINPVADAHKAGIPIIIIDTALNSEDYDAALLTDNKGAGSLCAETLIKKLKDNGVKEDAKAQIAIQVSSTGSQTVMDRVSGFNEYWSANAPKSWEVLNDAIKVNDGDVQKAINFGQDFITTYPDLKALFAPNNGSTVGFATALKESGRKDIFMLGFDFSNEIADLIQNTDFEVTTVLQRQYLMGYDGIKTGVELVQGKKPAEKKIDTGVMVVDKSNVASKEVQDIVNIKTK